MEYDDSTRRKRAIMKWERDLSAETNGSEGFELVGKREISDEGEYRKTRRQELRRNELTQDALRQLWNMKPLQDENE